jgi:hypothetical protein
LQTLLETVRALGTTELGRLSDIHIVADGRHATAYLCMAQPGASASTHLVREVLPVGLKEQLQTLTASGLLGELHLIVLHGDDTGREFHLLAKTHTGSAAERAAWRQSLA